jgi:predicted neuraminidase
MLPRRVWKWTEPTLAELGDGSVVMLFRQDGTGLLWKSVSTDFGESWSEPVSSGIPNPGNKPKLLQDGRGRIILIHTPNAEKDKRFPLQVWVSEDDMRSWSRKITVESGEGFFCYPDGYVTEDNKKVRFTYENRHDIFLVETELDDGTETCVRGNRGKRGCE